MFVGSISVRPRIGKVVVLLDGNVRSESEYYPINQFRSRCVVDSICNSCDVFNLSLTINRNHCVSSIFLQLSNFILVFMVWRLCCFVQEQGHCQAWPPLYNTCNMYHTYNTYNIYNTLYIFDLFCDVNCQ